jgi:UPF0755 protein
MRSLKRIFAAGIIIFLFTLSLFLTRSVSTAAPDYDEVKIVADMEEVVIDIPAGASGSDIASLLFEAGVVKSSQSYFRVAVADIRSKGCTWSTSIDTENLGTAGVRTTSRPRSNSQFN